MLLDVTSQKNKVLCMTTAFITPNWPAPKNVRAISTCCGNGYSKGNYLGLNVAMHVGDQPEHVEKNRQKHEHMLFCKMQKIIPGSNQYENLHTHMVTKNR